MTLFLTEARRVPFAPGFSIAAYSVARFRLWVEAERQCRPPSGSISPPIARRTSRQCAAPSRSPAASQASASWAAKIGGLIAVLFDIPQCWTPDTHGLRGENGGFKRQQVVYDWTHSVEVTAGIITYMSGDELRFQDIDDNRHLFAKVEYRF